ncbi:D-alanyl-D-alanine carboxypeptidase [Streptomyces sp. NPDC046881]|uniref:D-alanyl-D-alanine carboxypeptidase n=1 Tax=Streptomyces sp. NPDC046881 TaxID=3155374 RepID=UPI0033CC9E86
MEAEGSSDARTEAKIPSPTKAEAETPSDAKAKTEGSKAGSEGAPDANAESEGAPDAKAESEGAPDAKAEESADADADPAADGNAEGKADARAESGAGDAGDTARAGAKGVAEGKARAGAKSDADSKAGAGAKADAEAVAGDEDVAAGKATAGSGAGSKAATAGGRTPAGKKADAGTKADAEADADSKAGTARGKTPAGKKANAGTEADAEAVAAGKATAGAGADADADAKAVAGDKASAGTEDVAGAKAALEAVAAGEATAGADADADAKRADSKAVAGGKADADAEAVAGGKAGAGTEDVAGAEGVGGEGVAETVDGDGPEDADGGDAPQGPPADDDESRTGGAGGNTDADGEAEAEGDAPGPEADAAETAEPPVDQPTTVFKAPRPKKTEVDQPTTMLKLGGKPKAPESDAERTSKFVALRDDLRQPAAPKPAAPKPTAPKPATTPQPAPDVTTPVPQVGPERTTQQPLPPKPPLDLLAELTNTPPPPETPVRTLVRRVKIWTPLVLLLAVVLAVVQAVRPLPSPTLALTGEETYTFDGSRTTLPWPGEGQGWIDADGIGTMGHFGKQTPVAIGSVAKTMTAYIILKHHPLKPGQEGPKIKVDAKAEKEGGYDKAGESTLNTVKAGSYLTEKQALSAVLIPSANNIARLLARWDAGSEAAFVKEMNATARELGMTHTTYTDPSGLKESTVSTAEDQVKLGRAFVKVPALVSISSAASWTDPSGHFWPNYNELPYRIGAIGIKTGSTTAAGGNLLFASRKQVGGRTVTLVGAILGQHKPKILETVNAVSKTALLAAQDALTSSKILKKGDVVGYVDDRLGGHTPIVVTQDVTAAGWAGMKVRLSFAPGTVPHTAKAGTRVGTLTVGDGTSGAVKVPVALQKDLAEPGFGAKLTRLG